MDCEEFDTTTMDLLYGELDSLNEAAALRHLHHCTRCRCIWNELRSTRDLADVPQDDPPLDLFDSILIAERRAHKYLPMKERFSRAISIAAGYAMRPQFAMAAMLLLMIGSSLVFIRTDPTDRARLSVTERGSPLDDSSHPATSPGTALVFDRREQELVHSRKRGDLASAETPPPATGARSRVAASKKVSAPEEHHSYSEAMSAYQMGRYAEAERLFSEIAAGTGIKAASAAIHAGHAARNGSGCQRAAALYDAVATKYRGSPLADEASWHAAACYRSLGQVAQARARYRALESRKAFKERAKKAIDQLESAPQQGSVLATKKAVSSKIRVQETGDRTESSPTASPPASKTKRTKKAESP